jgi:hypothetical protein
MNNVVPITSSAAAINAAHLRACRNAVEALEAAAECGRLLASEKRKHPHGEWGSWIAGSLEFGERQARKYMQLADGWAQIEAKRNHGAVLGINDALKLISQPKDARLKPGTIIVTEDEDPDYDEPSSVGLPDDMRIRGLFARASQAKEMAEADDMAGIETTDLMREAVSQTAKAWINLLSKLEGE